MWAWAGRRIEEGRGREAFLGPFGPASMLLLFGLWAAGLISGFGLLYWTLQESPRASPVFEQIYMSGVTFFTLGYGDVVPHAWAARALAVVQAGCGIGFIAVVIGYLPVLYQFFSRREAHVIQLDGRAGSPPTAGTLLARHAQADGMDQLDTLLREWEVWASELLESHLSYPMLAYYRSQHDNESWLAAVGCVMEFIRAASPRRASHARVRDRGCKPPSAATSGRRARSRQRRAPLAESTTALRCRRRPGRRRGTAARMP